MRRILYAAIAVFGIGLDQAVKYWAKTVLIESPGREIRVWEGVFHLSYFENTGAAFGILPGQRWFFLLLTGLVSLAVIYVLFFRKKILPLMPGIPVSILLAGALGNWIDRAFFGYVIDLFYFRLINFAVFNVADAFVVCSVICIAAWTFFSDSKLEKKNKNEIAEKAEGGKSS